MAGLFAKLLKIYISVNLCDEDGKHAMEEVFWCSFGWRSRSGYFQFCSNFPATRHQAEDGCFKRLLVWSDCRCLVQPGGQKMPCASFSIVMMSSVMCELKVWGKHWPPTPACTSVTMVTVIFTVLSTAGIIFLSSQINVFFVVVLNFDWKKYSSNSPWVLWPLKY